MLAVLLGYVLGSIPVSLLVARAHGVDLRRTSDGNPGAWNALEQLGGRRAWPAFIGDGLKALVAGAIGLALGDWWTGLAAVAAAMLGHAFPLWAPSRGGKAVMCFVGGAFALAPAPALICLAACGACVVLRDFALGARVGVFAFPFVQATFQPIEHVAGTGALMTLIGLLFLLRRGRSAPATTAPGPAPPG